MAALCLVNAVLMTVLLIFSQSPTAHSQGTVCDSCPQMLLITYCMPMMLQHNLNGSNFFNRSWDDFRNGFNDSSGNYWAGNELIRLITLDGDYKLRLELQSDSTDEWFWAEYSQFVVQGEVSNYQILVSGYSGNAGFDALSNQNGQMFTTLDRDNDQYPNNCAVLYTGGFWYNYCGHASLNGMGANFFWSNLPGGAGLKSSRIWLMCKN